MITEISMPAGTVLAAADALRERRTGVWTDAEVAVLMLLAFRSGQAATVTAEMAEMICQHLDHATARETYDQAVARRLAEMDAIGRARAEREGRPYRVHPGGPVDWHTGRPLRHLAVAA